MAKEKYARKSSNEGKRFKIRENEKWSRMQISGGRDDFEDEEVPRSDYGDYFLILVGERLIPVVDDALENKPQESSIISQIAA